MKDHFIRFARIDSSEYYVSVMELWQNHQDECQDERVDDYLYTYQNTDRGWKFCKVE